MRHWLFLLLLLAIATLGYAKSTIDFGRYYALVIGNNEYEYLRDLRTAVADAEAVSKILEKKYRFDVTLLRNARRTTILEELNKITSQLTEQDNLLIYYAGHGTLDKYTNTGYWQPVEARSESDTFWIPTTDINRYLTRMNAKHVLVIADSCYAGSLLTRGEEAQLLSGEEPQTWLRRMLEQRSRTALTSGWLEPVQDTGSGDHSVFAEVLLNILHENDNILDGHSLFQRLKRPVTTRASASEQIPQYSDIKSPKHEGGDFLLVPNTLQDIEVNLLTPSNLPDWLFRGEGSPKHMIHCSKPTVPVLVEPRQNGIQPNHYYGDGEPWKFSWLESTCEGGSIIKYQLVVQAVGYPRAAIDELVDETSYVGDTSGTIGKGGNWTWKVRAIDDKNQFSDWSEVRSFSVPPWDAIDISPKRKTVHLNENKITMEPSTGFILSTHEITSGINVDRDIWWNNLELVPGDRMCSIGQIEDLNAIKKISKRCILKFAGFEPEEGEGFLLEIVRKGQKQYAAIRVVSVEKNSSPNSITLEWLYPFTITK